MSRKILLLEPNYKNKYPPIGLMKLATYHRRMGDNVVFYKGDLNDFVISDICTKAINKFLAIDRRVNWKKLTPLIFEYIKTGKTNLATEICQESSIAAELIKMSLQDYRTYFRNKEYFKYPQWDRVCIATLFTFYWDITIETIEFAKKVVKDTKQIWVGGVLASVVPHELEKATDIKPHIGLLSTPGILDKGNPDIIDELSLDYSILDEIDYKYPESGSYYGYMTRGCKNSCAFCAVPVIEPVFIPYIPMRRKIRAIRDRFGEQKNLLLLDNNVFASSEYFKIINEIKACGFVKGAKFSQPNYLDIAVKRLRDNFNDKAYIKKSVILLKAFLERLEEGEKEMVYELLVTHEVLKEYTATKEAIFAVYEEINELYEARRLKSLQNRYVDFNQGVDARLITERKMKKLSEIPISPLRIAFDEWNLHLKYERAIELAAKYGIKNLSNYLLYNFRDKPVDLYSRLKLNVELCEKYHVNIYSFPMKYHPIDDPQYFHNREYLGANWNRKFIRAIQAVLNATKGKIGKGKSFFEKAFGIDENEFQKILYMPEAFIIYRFHFERTGQTEAWWQEYCTLSKEEVEIANSVIHSNDFSNIDLFSKKPSIYRVLKYYTISRDNAQQEIAEIE